MCKCTVDLVSGTDGVNGVHFVRLRPLDKRGSGMQSARIDQCRQWYSLQRLISGPTLIGQLVRVSDSQPVALSLIRVLARSLTGSARTRKWLRLCSIANSLDLIYRLCHVAETRFGAQHNAKCRQVRLVSKDDSA